VVKDNVTAFGLMHGVAESDQQRAELVEGNICIVSTSHLRRHFHKFQLLPLQALPPSQVVPCTMKNGVHVKLVADH
jgi:hypothetical protein